MDKESTPDMSWEDAVNGENGVLLDEIALRHLKTDQEYLTDQFEDELVGGLLKSRKDGSLVRPSSVVIETQARTYILEILQEEIEKRI